MPRKWIAFWVAGGALVFGGIVTAWVVKALEPVMSEAVLVPLLGVMMLALMMGAIWIERRINQMR